MPNTAEGNRVISYIAAHPEQHDQANWFLLASCGTIACFAGTTVLLNGYKPVWRETDRIFFQATSLAYYGSSGASYSVRWEAANILGLSGKQAHILFYRCNSLEDIKVVWSWISEGIDDSQLEHRWNQREDLLVCECYACLAPHYAETAQTS